LAFDIATGTKRDSPWAPGPAGQVVIIGAEDENEEFHRRFDRLLQPSVLDRDLIDTIDLLKKNLFIVPRVGEDNLMTSDHGGEVTHTGLVDRLALAVAGAENLRLIVIDPVARFRGGEENAAEDTTRFVEEAERLAKLTGAAVLLVHHANKLSIQSGEQNQAAARGSSALSDGVRLQINLSPMGEKEKDDIPGVAEDERVMKALITKTNYSIAGDTILLRRDDVGRLMRIDVKLNAEIRAREVEVQVARMIESEAAAGHIYSKNSFAQRFAGVAGPFRVGVAALKEIVDRAVRRGLVEISAGKGKVLVAKTPPAAPDQATVDG
jgi:RecA-family ATPase